MIHWLKENKCCTCGIHFATFLLRMWTYLMPWLKVKPQVFFVITLIRYFLSILNCASRGRYGILRPRCTTWRKFSYYGINTNDSAMLSFLKHHDIKILTSFQRGNIQLSGLFSGVLTGWHFMLHEIYHFKNQENSSRCTVMFLDYANAKYRRSTNFDW